MIEKLYDMGIYVYEIDPIGDANEMVTENADGTVTIFVSRALCYEKKLAAVRHALEHVENDDFHAAIDADEIERIRHES